MSTKFNINKRSRLDALVGLSILVWFRFWDEPGDSLPFNVDVQSLIESLRDSLASLRVGIADDNIRTVVIIRHHANAANIRTIGDDPILWVDAQLGNDCRNFIADAERAPAYDYNVRQLFHLLSGSLGRSRRGG
jgi:hypothetical protein